MKTHVGVSPFLPVGLIIPQHCPFCSFLHAFWGPPLYCSLNLSLPKRHRKPCIVCPATKGNAKTPKWPPHSQPTPLTQHPQTLGEPGVPRLPKKTYTTWHPLAAATYPFRFLFFERGMPGDHWPLPAGFGGKSGGAMTVETCQSPCNRVGWERLLCSLCNCVAERLPLYVSPVQLRGGGMRAGWKGLPILYQRCYISVMGWGWGGVGITGAIEVETPPPSPRPANVPFCSKSF